MQQQSEINTTNFLLLFHILKYIYISAALYFAFVQPLDGNDNNEINNYSQDEWNQKDAVFFRKKKKKI